MPYNAQGQWVDYPEPAAPPPAGGMAAPTPTQLRLQDRLGRLSGKQTRIEDILAGGVGRQRERRLNQRLARVGRRIDRTQGAIDAISGLPAPEQPPPSGPTFPPPGGPTPTIPGGTLADLLGDYAAPMTDASRQAQSFFTSGLSRLNMLKQPTFEEQFGRYREVAEREADRNAAKITEAFGARGARYGSDLLRAQGDLRRDLTMDLGVQADQINRGINEQRLAELQALGNFGFNFDQQENQRRQTALQYLFADAMRRTGPPPLLAGAAQYASAYGGPTTIVGGQG